jgi:hypothetical protein
MQYIVSAIYSLILAIIWITPLFILVMIWITPFAMPFLLKWKGSVASLILSGFLSLIACVLLVFLFAYLPDLYVSVRLDYLGFDFDGWTDEERVRNIAPEFRDEAIKLYFSRMGIGWTFKAIIGAFLLIPYQIFASSLLLILSKFKA